MLGKLKQWAQRANLLHLAAISAAAMSFGAIFDAWWHVVIGRDNFLVLPHLFVHAGVAAILLISLYAWRTRGLREWRATFRWMLLVPLSLPFDEAWHYFRGKETVDSALIVWSPPHVLLFIGAIGATISLLRMVQNEKSVLHRKASGSLLLAALLNFLFIITGPFFPLGPFAYLGFYGAIVFSGILVFGYLYARRNLPSPHATVVVGGMTALSLLTLSDAGIIPGSGYGSYPYVPAWIVIMAQIVPAILMDLLPKKSPGLVGSVVGLAYGIVMFLGALYFADPSFGISETDAMTGILSSLAGGLLAGLAYRAAQAK